MKEKESDRTIKMEQTTNQSEDDLRPEYDLHQLKPAPEIKRKKRLDKIAKKKKTDAKILYYQSWEESEEVGDSEWSIRPDGCSLHLTKEDANRFCTDFMERQREFFVDSGITGTPDEYTRPAGNPYMVRVPDEIYKMVVKSAYGIKFAESKYYEPVCREEISGWQRST